MSDVHVITRKNRSEYAQVLQDYHRKRHDIFVGERKWMSLASPDGLEVDEYDDEHSVYLLALEGESVVGGQRLYPTLRPHMISRTFPDLVEGRIPTGSRIMEWTRYFIVRERRRTHVDGQLMASVQRYCLDEGVTDLTAVAETWWLPRWHQYGFDVRPLGLPQMVEGQPTLAVRIQISEESYETALSVAGLRDQDVVRRDPRVAEGRRLPDAA